MDGSTALAILDKKINSVESTVQSVTLGSDKKSIVITTVDGVSFSVSIPNAVDNPTLLNKFTVANGKLYYDGKKIAEYTEIPTTTSQLTNDSGFITSANLPNLTPYQTKNDSDLNTTNKTVIGAINELKTNINNINVPTKTSQLTNDSGYITNSDIPTIPTKVSQLTNDSDYVTQTEMTDAIADAVTGGTVDLTGYQKSRDTNLATTDKTVVGAINELKDSIDNFEGGTGEGLTNEEKQQLADAYAHSQSPHVSANDIPTKVSQLNNDSGFITSIPEEYVTDTELNAKGYLTEHQDISGLQPKSDTGLTTTNKTVVGGINEVKNTADSKSKIETYTKAEFEGLAQKDDDTYYIITDDMETATLPTKLSQLENDSGYVTTTEMDDAIANAQLGDGSEGGLTIYTTLAQLSLTTGTTTTAIFNAMSNNSMLKLEVANNTEVTDIPTNASGILMIDKGNSATGFDIQYKLSSNSGTATNALYIGQLQGSNGSSLTWRRLCSTSIEDSEETVMLSLPSNFTGVTNGAYVKYKIVNGWCIVSFTVGVTKITTSTSNYQQCATGLPPSAGIYYYGLFSENGNTATQLTVMFRTDGTLRILAKGSEVSAQDFYLGNFAYPVKES